jgi:glycosyltransferase involved in cell wall biosynthesis
MSNPPTPEHVPLQGEQPTTSVITIAINNLQGLRDTVASVQAQRGMNIEHIVIDGGSSDGSTDYLRSLGSHVRWVSEPDAGIYDAQNKGIRLARGRFLLFLNSGDHFVDENSLTMAAARLDETDLQSFDIICRGHPQLHGGRDFVKAAPDHPTFSYFAHHTLPHQSTFIRRELFERHGEYDTSLKIVADWKAFMLWICRHHCSYRHHPLPLSVFDGNGLSSRPENRSLLLAERRRVLEEEFPAFLPDADELEEARTAVAQVRALRHSRVVRVLQRVGLLWRF